MAEVIHILKKQFEILKGNTGQINIFHGSPVTHFQFLQLILSKM